MKVDTTHVISEDHSIEFGSSTWNDDQKSVRNRYVTSNGGFSPHSSSEIPIQDIVVLTVQTLKRDYLSVSQAMEILQAAADLIQRSISLQAGTNS